MEFRDFKLKTRNSLLLCVHPFMAKLRNDYCWCRPSVLPICIYDLHDSSLLRDRNKLHLSISYCTYSISKVAQLYH